MRQGVALAAAIVVAAAASVLFLSPPLPHLSAPQVPRALRDYGQVPTGVPVLYGAAPSNRQWLTAFDWQGQPRGTVKLTAPLSHELVPEPHCFVVEDAQSLDEVLYVDIPGQPLNRRVGAITREANAGQVGVEAVECNFARNMAIAVRTAVGRPTDAWAVRLSDAGILGHWSYGATLYIVPSTDGSLLAENGENGGLTRIRSIPDGAVVATLPPEDAIGAFSDDNRFAVIGPVVSVAQIRVIDWRSRSEVWHYGIAGWVMRAAVNPGSGDLALAIATDDQHGGLTQDDTYSLVIVHPDGTADQIADRYAWVFPPYADGYYPYKGGAP
jgi:hypothetical protein